MSDPERPSRDAIREQWIALAGSYLEFRRAGRGFNEMLLRRPVRQLLGDVRGRRILDAGCGSGELAVECAGEGAIVTAIDVSPRMIQEVRERAERAGVDVEAIVADLEDLRPIPDGRFDAVVCSVAIAGRLDEIVAELARVLPPRGRLVFAEVHPTFDKGREEERDGTPCVVVSGYFERRVRRATNPFGAPAGGGEQPFVAVSYTLEDYFEAFARSGLVVERLLEPSSGSEGEADKRARAASYPIFFVVAARKL